MPTFDTPEPISVTIELGVGNVRLTASDRTDTVVEVRPTDESDESDVKAADQTRVEYADGKLLVNAPKVRPFDFSRTSRSVEVTIELPAGSRVHATAQLGDLRGTGPLGQCRFKTGTGDVQLDRTGPLRLHTATGHVTVDRVAGDAEITTSSGMVDIGDIDGTADVKNSNGNTHLGTVTGEAHIRAANGDISIDHAASAVTAKTANGRIRLGDVARGTVELKTAMGDVDVGIGTGAAAWLDVHTSFGRLHNSLENANLAPDQSGETVEVHAHTSYGDITVRRA